MTTATVLVVDDDRANLDSVARIFQREGLATLAASNGTEALELLRQPEVGVMVTDLMMPGMDGQELLKAARAIRPDVEVVLMTAYGTVETAVAAMKDGAYDFITKPLKRHVAGEGGAEGAGEAGAASRRTSPQGEARRDGRPGGRPWWASPPPSAPCWTRCARPRPPPPPCSCMGESGTGKELAARALHEHSSRAKGPFVAVNCAALPESILEAELFGVERGAFTGAVARREGRFERASGGTLFLDEVGEMPLSAQVKLLRVLQEGEIERLGGTQTVKVDVRLVAATNKDLQKRGGRGPLPRGPLLPPQRGGDPRARRWPRAARTSRCWPTPSCAASPPRTASRCAASPRRPLARPRELRLARQRARAGARRGARRGARPRRRARGRAICPETRAQGPAGLGRPARHPHRHAHGGDRAAGASTRPCATPRGDKTLAARLLGIAARTIYRKLEREASGAPAGGLRRP